jgi:hypothetical protein
VLGLVGFGLGVLSGGMGGCGWRGRDPCWGGTRFHGPCGSDWVRRVNSRNPVGLESGIPRPRRDPVFLPSAARRELSTNNYLTSA